MVLGRSHPQLPWAAETGSRTFFWSRSTTPFARVARYEWDLDGDGIFEVDTGDTPYTTIHYATPGVPTVSVRQTGENGETAVVSQSVDVRPWPAVIDVNGAPAGERIAVLTGTPVALSAERSKPRCGDVGRVEWDLDGDGTYERDTGDALTTDVTFPRSGAAEVGVRISRPGGRVDSGRQTLDVRPGPPAGEVGVSVEDGAQFVRDPNVMLDLVWPKLATRVLVSNDGGFRRAQSFALGERIPWRLASSGPERLPKTVYVRYVIPESATASDVTRTDDVILDETVPVLTSARRVRKAVTVKARDTVSGAAAVQLTTDRRKPGKAIAVAKKLRGKRSISQAFRYKGRSAPWVRVLDRAGNASKWRRAAR